MARQWPGNGHVIANTKGEGMELVVIILNYRTPQCTIQCLESLARERANGLTLRVVLVDNASGDDSTACLSHAITHHQWSDWVILLPQPLNLGFSGGNNAGIRHALNHGSQSEYILLLNSDTMVHPGCLTASLARMREAPRIGALSCMVRNPDSSVQNVCRRFPRPDLETFRAIGLPHRYPKLFGWADLDDPKWNRETTAREVDWIGGAFMLLRADVLKAIGGLDETFFFYGEDVALCHEIRKRGWRIFFDPSGEITHLGGGSSDASRLMERRKLTLVWRARIQVQRKCYGTLSALWMRWLYAVSVSLSLCSMFVKSQRGTFAWGRTSRDLSVLLNLHKE